MDIKDRSYKEQTKEKLLSSNLITDTSILINPEAIQEMSPTIPEGFHTELIPADKCEKQIAKLAICLIEEKFDNVACENMQYEYYQCKKWRDGLLFKRIKDWEVEKFNKMDDKNKKIHVAMLKAKKLEYIKNYEAIETMPSNRAKRIRFTSDIEQLQWRINYLNESFI